MSVRRLINALVTCLGALAVLGLLMGCREGYGSGQAAIVEVHRMDNTQRLKFMNTLGQQAHRDRQWRYQLLGDCKLHVSSKGTDAESSKLAFSVVGASFVLKSDRADDAHDVRVTLPSVKDAIEFSILESEQWHHAAELVSIMKFIQRDCQVSVTSRNTLFAFRRLG